LRRQSALFKQQLIYIKENHLAINVGMP